MSKIKSVHFYIQIIAIPCYIKKHYLQKHTCRNKSVGGASHPSLLRHCGGTCLVSFITAVKHLKAFHLHKEAELRQLLFVYWNWWCHIWNSISFAVDCTIRCSSKLALKYKYTPESDRLLGSVNIFESVWIDSAVSNIHFCCLNWTAVCYLYFHLVTTLVSIKARSSKTVGDVSDRGRH